MVVWGEGASVPQFWEAPQPLPSRPMSASQEPSTSEQHGGSAHQNNQHVIGTPDQITGSSPSFKDTWSLKAADQTCKFELRLIIHLQLEGGGKKKPLRFVCINYARRGVSLSSHVMILHEIPGLVPPDLFREAPGKLCKCVSGGGRQGEGKCRHRFLRALEQPLLSGWRLLLSSRISNRYNYHLDKVQDLGGSCQVFHEGVSLSHWI